MDIDYLIAKSPSRRICDQNGRQLDLDTNGSIPVNSRLVDEAGQPYGNKQVDGKQRVSSTPYYADIAAGKVPGHVPVYKFGNNNAVGTTQATIWEPGGLYPWAAIDAAAGQVIVSSSSNDDVLTTGIGVWSVIIYGLDLAGNDQSETVSMAGQAGQISVGSYSRVFRIICQVGGTATANVGNIYVGTGTLTGGVPAVIWAMAPAGENQTLQTVYTVPAGKTLYMVQAEFSINGIKGGEGRIYVKPPGQLFQIKDVFHLAGGLETHEYKLPRSFVAGTDIDFRGTAGAINTDYSANFEGWYE